MKQLLVHLDIGGGELKGIYNNIRESHAMVESAVEILFNVLNYNGYYADKNEKKQFLVFMMLHMLCMLQWLINYLVLTKSLYTNVRLFIIF